MDTSIPHHNYIINHMDEFLFEWSLCEYLQIDSYLSPLPNVSLYLSNFNIIEKYTSTTQKSLNENIENQLKLRQSSKLLQPLAEDISYYISTDKNLITLPEKINASGVSPKKDIDFSKVCLLDMRAEKTLCPSDGAQFGVFIFGGILGDHPPRDRTAALRKQGFELRNLGKLQMSTDTAALVTSLIVDRGRKYEEIAFVDEPELKGRRKGESVQIEGFRYVDLAYDLVSGGVEEGNRGKEPRMAEKIRKDLIFRELDLNDFM